MTYLVFGMTNSLLGKTSSLFDMTILFFDMTVSLLGKTTPCLDTTNVVVYKLVWSRQEVFHTPVQKNFVFAKTTGKSFFLCASAIVLNCAWACKTPGILSCHFVKCRPSK